MREVKFRQRKYRFWDLEENRMIYPEKPDCLYLDQNGKVNYCQIIIDDLSETDRFIPMDWLGITDKNGKEIYEGDMLRFHNPFKNKKDYEKNPYSYLLVTWNEQRCGWNIAIHEDVEVIGNPYENPELLKINKEHE